MFNKSNTVLGKKEEIEKRRKREDLKKGEESSYNREERGRERTTVSYFPNYIDISLFILGL